MISMFIIRYSPCPLSACSNKFKVNELGDGQSWKLQEKSTRTLGLQREGTNGMIQQDSLGIMAMMRSTAVIIDSEVK